jgi:hypothetical protein
MSNRDDVKPQALMRYMEDDESEVSPLSHATRRVKIEENWTWNLRFLPVQMGKDKMPYVRLARHWRNKAPIFCPQWTPESYGGNREVTCPICATAERLIQSGSEEVRRVGFDASCKIARKFWCLVIDQQDPRGRVDEMPTKEILNPYEMEMTKTTWDDYKKYQKLAMTRQKNTSDYLCLDLETGCNFLATSTGKGVRLDRTDPGHVFDGIIELNDPNWDKWVAEIFGRIRQPVIVLPTAKQIDDFVAKVEEDAEGGSRRRRRGDEEEDDRGGRGGRGRFRGEARGEDRDDDRGFRGRRRSDEDQDEDDRPARRSTRTEEAEQDEAPAPRRRVTEQRETEPEPQASTPPPRRSAPAKQPDPEPEAEQQEAPTPPPRRSSAAPAAPQQARRQAPAPEPEAEAPETAEEAPAPPPRRQAPAPAAPPPARRQAPAPVAENGNGDDGDLAPQRPPPRRSAAPQQAGVDEEEDNVPEETRDPAPAAQEQVEEPPPPVAAKAPAPATGKDPQELQARLARLNKRTSA